MNVKEQIEKELAIYLTYCQMAANHDAYEIYYRHQAHTIFYHIQELRSAKPVPTDLNKVA
jgi:hypothetical protein